MLERHHIFGIGVAICSVLTATALLTKEVGAAGDARDLRPFKDPSGMVRTFSTTGDVDRDNPFFKPNAGLNQGNGQACVTCHLPDQAWSVTPEHAQERFAATGGTDPLFRLVDTANSAQANVSTVDARRQAYSLVLSRAVVRVTRDVPATAEFEVTGIDNPYGSATSRQLAVYRRPLPTTNFRFLSAVNWDGRSGGFPNTHKEWGPQNEAARLNELERLLRLQNAKVITGLLEGPNLVPAGDTEGENETLQQLVKLQMSLFTAQEHDDAAGELRAMRAQGGPENLARQQFFIGINDPLGLNATGAPFDREAFTLFDAWLDPHGQDSRGVKAGRAAVARGQQLFDTKPIAISGVGGLNDELGEKTIQGTCTTCHDANNVGDHSVAAPLNIGISDPARRTPAHSSGMPPLPVYTLRNLSTGKTVQTTDPGRGLITGKWTDIGRFKGPILRGLAARAPYFHNGFATSLEDVVDFYDDRFEIGLTRQEKRDLVAFLRAL
jgi:cytochrome c peroxidase